MGTNAYYYLKPIGLSPSVKHLWIVRPSRTLKGDIPDGEFVLAPSQWRLWRFVQMLWHCIRLGLRGDVKAFTSFNPVPYGLIVLLSALFHKKPVHLGFVGGLDWYHHAKGPLGRWLRPLFRRADFFTVTGTSMRQEMIDYGFPAEKISILPHGIDVENYPISDPELTEFTCIYVGQLITRKRVDVIIRALALLQDAMTKANLIVVGCGPEEESLRQMVKDLELDEVVTFAGFHEQVQPFLAQARILVMASEMEGLPFAVIEAMCCGLVPISTPVGTVEDLIINGENGFLFPPGDSDLLARHIKHLEEDPQLYRNMRERALTARDRYSFDSATAIWDGWLSSIVD